MHLLSGGNDDSDEGGIGEGGGGERIKGRR